MRIAQLISRKSCDSGGSLQALLLAASLKEMGEDVVFVSKGKGCAERAARFGVRHFSVPMKGYLDWRSLIRLGGFVRKEGVDVAHAHKGLALWFSLVCAAVFRPEMKVFANRGVSFPLGYWGSLKYRHPLVKGVICVAYAVKNQMARAWVSPERLKVVYGSVNPKFFSRISQFRARKRFGLDSRNVVFALVGNFRPWKGHLLMAEAVSSLLAKRKDVFCLFAGKEKRSILDGLKRYLGGSFASLGYREDAEYVIAASDVLVNASTEGEGLPGVVREAMAVGRAVVATDVAGNKEVVRNGKTGVVVSPSVSEIFSAVKLLAEQPMLRKKLGATGRRVALSFSSARRAEAVRRLYESG